ncbi:hypothetical protein F2Q69_00055495 [Brassica cretica]|uniref:Uncharacterized protein n=1 Tax=Brassica cretica TaxID=69181 RepID=A0A8S9MUC6_BRACR|nr:hypothetical protein F2Q69_00055495 [Brassica cretica]
MDGAFGLWRCRRWGHELTVDTEAFERAVVEISKLGGSGGGQFNVPPGRTSLWKLNPWSKPVSVSFFRLHVCGIRIMGTLVDECERAGLWRCRRWGHELTVDTEAFERAVVEISKLGGSGSGQFSVPPGRWLTTPFNLTSHMTLFLAEDSEILGVD